MLTFSRLVFFCKQLETANKSLNLNIGFAFVFQIHLFSSTFFKNVILKDTQAY